MSWQLAVILVGLIALVPLIWRRPVITVFVMVGAAVVLENFQLAFPDSLTDTIPFFTNLNNSAALPISINPAELVLVIGIVAWLTGAARRGGPRAPAGPLLRAYLIFMVVVLLAEGVGLMNGASFNITLWELRPQIYAFILFMLTASLVTRRRDVAAVAAVFLAGAAFKGGIGWYRYFVTLHTSLPGESILGHEDSYFLLLYLVAVVCALIWIRRRIVLLLLLGSPIVALTMLENRRRVAMLALWAAAAVVVGLAIWFEPKVRKYVIVATVFTIAGFAIFVVTNWNSGDGLVGQVVRPVRTVMGQVDQRDYLSDVYRINENADLRATYQTSPVIGTGFGIPMLVPYPLADISQQDPFWQIITHNSVLWVAMRMGVVGMSVFWALIAMIILEGIRVVRSQEDPFLRAVAVFALAAVVGELVMAYGDKQLEAYRNMIFFGAMVGLVDAIPRVGAVTVTAPTRAPGWTPAPTGPTVGHAPRRAPLRPIGPGPVGAGE